MPAALASLLCTNLKRGCRTAKELADFLLRYACLAELV